MHTGEPRFVKNRQHFLSKHIKECYGNIAIAGEFKPDCCLRVERVRIVLVQPELLREILGSWCVAGFCDYYTCRVCSRAEILRDLSLGQCTIVDCHQVNLAEPRACASRLVSNAEPG